MVAIKSYTDLAQSKKLAEILPIESADMYIYKNIFFGALSCLNNTAQIGEYIKLIDKENKAYPCWSLAALLGVLPNENMLVKTTDGEYYCLAKDVMTEHYDNPIDACVEMILKLHELKML